MNLPFITIIIPTYRDWDRLALCLEALSLQTYPADQIEILVANNDPTDPVPQGYCLPPNCQVIIEEKNGSYAARNAALKLAKGEIIGFTDSDCVPDKDWVNNGVHHLTSKNEVDVVGGDIHLFRNSAYRTLGDLHDIALAFPQEKYVNTYHFAATANMFVYKRVLDQTGPFNQNLKSGGDYEWGQRAYQKGFKIFFAPDTVISHPTRSDYREVIRKTVRTSETNRMKNTPNGSMAQFYIKKAYNLLGIHIPIIKSYRQIKDLRKEKGFSILETIKLYFFLIVLYYIRNLAGLFHSTREKKG